MVQKVGAVVQYCAKLNRIGSVTFTRRIPNARQSVRRRRGVGKKGSGQAPLRVGVSVRQKRGDQVFVRIEYWHIRFSRALVR